MENVLAPSFSKPSAYNTIKTHHCPNCKSILSNRVSRGWMVKNVFFWLSVKRYRCDKCFKFVYVKSEKNTLSLQ